MSQENVDRMRESIEAMNRRDIQAVLRILDPEVRFEHRLAALEGNFVGLDGVWIRQAIARALEGFAEDAEWQTSDELPLGGVVRGRDHVLDSL